MTFRNKVMSPYQDNNSNHRLTSTKLRGGGGGGIMFLPLLSLSNPLWKACGMYLATDAFGALVSLVTGSHVHLDLIGSGAFAIAALPGISSSIPHIRWSSLAIAIWGTKLATFLFFRATQVGHDLRLEDTLKTVDGIALFWGITWLWNICCSMPYLLGLSSNHSGNPLYVKVGGIVYIVGLLIETMADLQKWSFKQANPGQFCNVGLWSISQHPNFMGNLILWSGIFIMNLPALIIEPSTAASASTEAAGILANICRFRRVALASISPLFMWWLFHGQATGTVTNSFQMANAKYGSDPTYQDYIQNTGLIFPKF